MNCIPTTKQLSAALIAILHVVLWDQLAICLTDLSLLRQIHLIMVVARRNVCKQTMLKVMHLCKGTHQSVQV